ncbi:N-acyl-aromatic-L-amino acid amidohydrolase (carboxylate-forming) B-like [Mastacembelus armatus]|uniref:N-acyl-aromatic-L-amino acid amidohydrolase n=1 Tax=Mastacembelus armatus TaxID=205130 RepID=A0A3Q3MAS9_9TELE|nr:N-acyl-aromatic-L-amino acid amidohydrolase (carboxylate-forming) B-like [Mastacembelus armatus]XP_026158371.1 N-acyl-aromatic-L-amino acid amidohydrolase (carboxylate-forming) B-like [Mastacembelus armatus]XP_026158372.1 N-acyl-aromatic-L-amino acid amidohydrolase (carboxylate-forming) B-like [Mastacembelus armatus]XP_026158373.1 N-acyl-aromatic-L-amino acid amidohydrolase (carboxylate-forming) B-like [Mastacembelus armatus]XP_026158374.1 N-acyl-aromatic-L-amino acid amidohydrolase (carboxy
MEHVSFPPLSRFAICGGTHGNEMTGVYMVRELQKKKLEKAGSVSITSVLSNPRAVDVCKRYIDKDLNRCFTNAFLSAPITDLTPYEVKRAQELNAQLGPKGSEDAVDLICDFHNTTANMGLCLIFYTIDWLTLHIYKYIKSKITSVPVRLIQLDLPISEAYSLESVGKHSFAIEIGPQPCGVLRADIFNIAKEALDLTMEWIQKFNSGSSFEGDAVEAYNMAKSVDYPRDPTTGELTAVIHPQLQDNDFKLLQPGDPVFLSFSGETVKHDGEELYPFFVNECAYYEKKIAFHLARKITLAIPSISVTRD